MIKTRQSTKNYNSEECEMETLNKGRAIFANQQINETESLCVRFIRKKYQCIMLFLLILFMTLEIIKLILDKINAENIENMFNFKRNIIADRKHFVNTTNKVYPEYFDTITS